MVTNTMMVPGTPGSMYNMVYKTLNAAYLCSRVMSMNVSLCAPGIQLPRTMLAASAPSGTMSPSCSFNCTGCGTITITGSDGLPVELLDFKVSALEAAPPG